MNSIQQNFSLSSKSVFILVFLKATHPTFDEKDSDWKKSSLKICTSFVFVSFMSWINAYVMSNRNLHTSFLPGYVTTLTKGQIVVTLKHTIFFKYYHSIRIWIACWTISISSSFTPVNTLEYNTQIEWIYKIQTFWEKAWF